ncbi:hypothetical protein EDB84DRAFT_1447436 [Lactarius hengduanensis]|nr:hypothetical protein EDB84DRAFT_1447436 [Lactarius hengduanensis]
MAPCRYAVSVSMGHGAASVSKCHSTVSLRCVGVVGVEGPRCRVVTARWCRRAMAPCCYGAWVSSVSMGHDAVLLRRVGVEGPWRRVVTPHGCRRCRWATTPCRYGASVSMGHGAAWVSKGHDTTWVSKGHGAVSLRHDAALVSMGHGAAWVSKGHDAAWVSKGHGAVSLRHNAAWVSMGHGATWVSKGHNAAWVSKGRDAAFFEGPWAKATRSAECRVCVLTRQQLVRSGDLRPGETRRGTYYQASTWPKMGIKHPFGLDLKALRMRTAGTVSRAPQGITQGEGKQRGKGTWQAHRQAREQTGRWQEMDNN